MILPAPHRYFRVRYAGEGGDYPRMSECGREKL